MTPAKFKISAEAWTEAKRLLPGVTEPELVDMVRHAAICTHEDGNRRYKEYVFDVDDGVVYSISASFAQENTGCEVCGGTGKIVVYEECEHCEGQGCKRCDDGLVLIRHHCPERCTERQRRRRRQR